MKLLKKQESTFNGNPVFLLGKDLGGDLLWLEAPKWDCGWYWGFGYVVTYNRRSPAESYDIDTHRHWKNFICGFKNDSNSFLAHPNENTNLFTATTLSDSESWRLADLMSSFYALKQTAEIFGRGYSHLAQTTSSRLIKDAGLTDKINNIKLPIIFKEVIKILTMPQKT